MPADSVRNVLIAPLDWGLGHATRCIPIIRDLLNKGFYVVVACSGPPRILLQMEFPGLEFLDLPGYNIRLDGSGKTLVWRLIFRIPGILRRIRRETAWLRSTCLSRRIDLIISDNRYGFYHPEIPSIFITHQLYIQSGLGRWANRILLNRNRDFIERFSACWVPDFFGTRSLAGILSHPPVMPRIPVRYCGLLSRFSPAEKINVSNPLLILISGPEPRRTAFENTVFRALENYAGQAVLVRGLPGDGPGPALMNPRVKVYNHLSSDSLGELLNTSDCVICRSGYSTVMDLARLQKKAILVPTAGQPEQEYLGAYLHDKKWAYSVPERGFDLAACLNIFREQAFGFPAFNGSEAGAMPVADLLDGLLLSAFR